MQEMVKVMNDNELPQFTEENDDEEKGLADFLAETEKRLWEKARTEPDTLGRARADVAQRQDDVEAFLSESPYKTVAAVPHVGYPRRANTADDTGESWRRVAPSTVSFPHSHKHGPEPGPGNSGDHDAHAAAEQDHADLTELKWEYRYHMLGPQTVRGKIAMDEELQFLVELYQSGIAGEPRHCKPICDTSTDPVACCWREKFQAIEDESSPVARRTDVFQAYKCDLVAVLWRHLRRSHKHPDGIPPGLQKTMRHYCEAIPFPTKEDYKRIRQETGLTNLGVSWVYSMFGKVASELKGKRVQSAPVHHRNWDEERNRIFGE